jgi:carboxynorspermidine decarboxylase
VFNTFEQWEKYGNKLPPGVQAGLRINPEYAEVETDLYNPCIPGSRLGITADKFKGKDLTGIKGLHFHTMCEQNSDVLRRTLDAVEEKFGKYMHRMEWVNFGGGHHITKDGYDIELLIRCIERIRNKYNVQVYLEPGEAVALNAGYLVSEVIDVQTCGNVILDASAACHMPDVLEMPYRPRVHGAGEPGEYPYTYRLAGNTCLAGDIIGEYSFKKPLIPGNKSAFEDMAIYTTVKNNTFNGMPLPRIAVLKSDGNPEVIKEFGYKDFYSRL